MITTLADCRASLEDALDFLISRQSELAGKSGYLDEAVYGLVLMLDSWQRIEEACQPGCSCSERIGPCEVRHGPGCELRAE